MDFADRIKGTEYNETAGIHTLQVNLGKQCNLTCTHCHVNAGPARTEAMTKETIDEILLVLKKHPFEVIDLTGGEPMMHSHIKYLIEGARSLVNKIIVRTNLVILNEPGHEDDVDFLAKNRVEVVASLPCYTKENTDAMRGDGTFQSCIQALRTLNAAGYGKNDDLSLHLVYNPGGAFLPGPQSDLEHDYKKALGDEFDVAFDNLYTITNLAIGRFAEQLKREHLLEEYEHLLEDNFNEATLAGMMCRNQISVSFDGSLYDCDFNQILDLKTNGSTQLSDLLHADVLDRTIVFGNHCYGCTAGAGSSCGGALA